MKTIITSLLLLATLSPSANANLSVKASGPQMAASNPALSTSHGPTVAASTHYGMVTISNSSNVPLTYEFRWGNGCWTQTTIRAGCVLNHYWAYPCPNHNRSPAPQIRFDSVGGDARTTWCTYSLTASAVSTKNCNGTRYNFSFAANGCNLDLYRG